MRERLTCAFIALAALLGARRLPAASVVYETPAEFAAAGSFDGDALPDVVVVDKASGAFRLGLQQGDGSFLWREAHASGVANLTGFSVGRLGDAPVDSLLFAEPTLNRVNAMLPDGQPQPIYAPGIGPSLVIAYDLHDLGNDTNRDDLFVATRLNSPPNPNGVTVLRCAATGTGVWCQVAGDAPLVHGNHVRFDDADHPAAIAAGGDGGLDRLDLDDTLSSLLVPLVQSGGLPTNSDWAYGTFGAVSNRDFLFYAPGETNLIVRGLAGSAPGPYALQDVATFAFAQPILRMAVLNAGLATRLLLVFGDGTHAAVYDFDGAGAPVLVQQFIAPAGQSFTVAAPLAGGDFLLLSGAGTMPTSSHWQREVVSGGSYADGPGGALPALHPLDGRANVWLYSSEPLADSSARLLARLTAGDWTSEAAALPGPVGVTAEHLLGSGVGLGAPSAVDLGPSPPGAAFALPNQESSDTSVFSFDAAAGAIVPDVAIAPPSARVDGDLNVTISAAGPLANIFYRVNGAAWQSYANPLALTNETEGTVVTVDAYAELAADQKSLIRSTTYDFSTNALAPPPAGSDADGNLLSDPWEETFGVHDPYGDADADGYSNLEELLAGTDPQDPGSHPVAPPADLSRPRLNFARGATTNGYVLSWPWPAAYASAVHVDVQAASTVTATFSNRDAVLTIEGETNRATVVSPAHLELYRLRLSLP